MPNLGTCDAIVDCVSNNPMVARVGILPTEEDWRQPFISYSKYKILQEDTKEKIGIRRRAPHSTSMKHRDSYTKDHMMGYYSGAYPV